MNQRIQNTPGLAALSPVQRETAQDRVYGQLRNALIRGAFDAGELFIVADVAARMSVSSMPVREALARLVSERALEAQPNRRVRVPLLTQDRARAINKARVLIEGDLATEAFAHLSKADIAHLEELMEQYDSATDDTAVAMANQAFHFKIYERAKSPVLLPFAESLWMQAGPYTRAAARLHKTFTARSGNLHHRGILDALRRGDRAGMIAALTDDITRAFDILDQAGEKVWGGQEGETDG